MNQNSTLRSMERQRIKKIQAISTKNEEELQTPPIDPNSKSAASNSVETEKGNGESSPSLVNSIVSQVRPERRHSLGGGGPPFALVHSASLPPLVPPFLQNTQSSASLHKVPSSPTTSSSSSPGALPPTASSEKSSTMISASLKYNLASNTASSTPRQPSLEKKLSIPSLSANNSSTTQSSTYAPSFYRNPINSHQAEIVKLNVGGVKYMTTKATLTRFTNSFFNALLVTEMDESILMIFKEGVIPAVKDDEGWIFIDRNGKYFEPILNFLRTDELFIPEGIPREAIALEADFYCLSAISETLRLMDSDACGGKFFDTLITPRAKDHGLGYSRVVQLTSSENHLVALFDDGLIQCWYHEVTSGWSLECTSDDLTSKGSMNLDTARVAFFSLILKTGRWFLAAFCDGIVFVFNKQGKFGEVELSEKTVDSLFFLKRGQELVAINNKSGKIMIVSMASLSIRTITHTNDISCVCVDPEHSASFCASASTLYQLMIGHSDNTQLAKLFSDPNKEEITVIRSKEQRVIFCGTDKGTIRRLELMYDHCQTAFVVRGHIHPITDIAFLGNKTLVSICDHNHVRAWNADEVHVNSYQCLPGAVFVEPFLIQSKQDRLEILDLVTGELLHFAVSVNGSHITTLCACYDHLFHGGAVLVTGHKDGSIQFWTLGILAAQCKRTLQKKLSN